MIAFLQLLAALLMFLTPLVAPAAEAATTPVRQPLEHFARLPRLARVSLSPDGQQIAALLNEQGRTIVIAQSASGGSPRALASSDNQKFQFNWVRWVSNQRLLASVRYASRRGFVGTLETRLVSIPAAGGETMTLDFSDASAGLGLRGSSRQLQDQVVDWLPGDGRHVLLQMAEAGEQLLPAVYKVNIENGERKIVQGPERQVVGWLTDRQQRVRVGVRRDREGRHTEVIARAPDGGAWRALWAFDDDKDAVWPLGFGADPQQLYVRALHAGRQAVFVVQLDDPALPRRLLLADEEHDVEGSLLVAPGSGEVLGLRGGGSDDSGGESRAELWSPAWRAQLQALDRALPGDTVVLVDISSDAQRYLVHASGNGRPGRYFLGDRRSGTLRLIGETYPELAPARLVGKQTATIKARDGLPLRSYITLPRGRSLGDGGAALPLVLLPHGGPASRDDTDFDAWTEFLADRGHAVLQVNFRGSDGYGHDFRQAGLKRWGLEMQDDLTDAVQWAQRQGLGAHGRVCIVGGSYGGYAALMGVVKTPDLYRCAVSFAGVTDLPALILHEDDFVGGRAALETMLGDLATDRARLQATSPALQAARIQVPVLLLHGTADRVVPVAQSQAMAQALRRAGKPHRYVEQEGGDHHLGRQEDRLQFFRELETFLDSHLQPQASPARP